MSERGGASKESTKNDLAISKCLNLACQPFATGTAYRWQLPPSLKVDPSRDAGQGVTARCQPVNFTSTRGWHQGYRRGAKTVPVNTSDCTTKRGSPEGRKSHVTSRSLRRSPRQWRKHPSSDRMISTSWQSVQTQPEKCMASRWAIWQRPSTGQCTVRIDAIPYHDTCNLQRRGSPGEEGA